MRTITAFLCAFHIATGTASATDLFSGLCEASAGAPLGHGYFAVASDETNELRIYRNGTPDPIRRVDMEGFTGFNKSDLEAAAIINSRVYWISSHSRNSDGEEKPKRQILFATAIVESETGPALEPVGKPFKNLKNSLVEATGVAAGELNIEGLASTAAGELLIGFRGPLQKGEAVIIPLTNPVQVIDEGSQPKWGPVINLALDDRGIRSLERIGNALFIAAGPVADGNNGSSIFRWDRSKKPTELSVDLIGLRPEALLQADDAALARILSDDGDDCVGNDDDPGPGAERHFRSTTFSIPDVE